jgi:hypothetical protein
MFREIAGCAVGTRRNCHGTSRERRPEQPDAQR